MWLASMIVENTGNPFFELREASKLFLYIPVTSYTDVLSGGYRKRVRYLQFPLQALPYQ